jgi:hypothetical protein
MPLYIRGMEYQDGTLTHLMFPHMKISGLFLKLAQ